MRPLLVLSTLGLVLPAAGGLVSTPVAAAPEGEITIFLFQFNPEELIVVNWDPEDPPTVVFANADTAQHHPHSHTHDGIREGSCFDAGVIGFGETSTVALVTEDGSTCWGMDYHCHIHPFMQGRIGVLVGP